MHPVELPTTYPLRSSRLFPLPLPLPLLLSILSHLSPLLFVIGCDEGVHTDTELFPYPYANYAGTIVASTIASLGWHLGREQKGGLFYLNILLSIVWASYDVYLGITRAPLPDALAIIHLNLLVFLLTSAPLPATMWQLCSVAKSLLVAYMVGCSKWKPICL